MKIKMKETVEARVFVPLDGKLPKPLNAIAATGGILSSVEQRPARGPAEFELVMKLVKDGVYDDMPEDAAKLLVDADHAEID